MSGLAAIKALRQRLLSTGRRLQLSGGKFTIRPAAGLLSHEETQRLERAVVSRTAMTVATARVLHEVLHGRIDARWEGNATGADGIELSVLLRRGWVRQVGGCVVLAEEVALGLEPPQ